MGWLTQLVAVSDLIIPRTPRESALLLRIAERAVREDRYQPPRVVERVVHQSDRYTALAARRLGVPRIRVSVCVAGVDGPPMSRPLFMTVEQRRIIGAAIESVRLSEGDRSISDGRALELIAADYLSGAGWPLTHDLHLPEGTLDSEGDRAK